MATVCDVVTSIAGVSLPAQRSAAAAPPAVPAAPAASAATAPQTRPAHAAGAAATAADGPSGTTATGPGSTITTGQWAALASSPNPTGQWFTSERGTRWWFDSGSLALDLAHTGRLSAVGDPAVRAMRPLETAADVDVWLSGRLACSPATDRDLKEVLGLRSTIARLLVAASEGRRPASSDVDMLNLVAATPDVAPRLEGGSRQAGRTLAAPRQALATIARDAVAVLSGQTSGRVRTCDAPDCGLVYLDTSRASTRRWCSMDRCGNRSKVRAHRARIAAAGDARD